MKKILRTFVFAIALILMMGTAVSAAIPYETYTYDIYGYTMDSPDAYIPTLTVNASYIGVDKLYGVKDIEVDDNGNVYIVDTDGVNNIHRVIVCDPYYHVSFIIDSFINSEGIRDTFNNPNGVFITEDEIYVCDTDNYRIVVFDLEGNYLRTLNEPKSDLFGENFSYRPTACAVTKDNAIYVVGPTIDQGVMVLNKDGSFIQFVGGTKVTLTAWERLMRNFYSEEQEASRVKKVSVAYNNIAIDNTRNFVYVTNNAIESANQYAQLTSKKSDHSPVLKLNPAGNDIMRRNGFFSPSGEVDTPIDPSTQENLVSNIVDVACGPEETWSIIDKDRSRIYTYDKDGKCLFIFGDVGQQMGNVTKDGAIGIVYQGDRILVLDGVANVFTVYSRTKYGNLIMEALHAQNERDYDAAVEKWNDVLKRNNNFDEAYIQIGLAYYRSGEYEKAVNYYELAYETENWSDAFREIRKETTQKYLWLIPIIAIVLLLAISWFFKYAAKVNKAAQLKVGRKSFKEELLYGFHVIFHPFDGFWDLKHEYRGSARAACVYVIITIAYFWYNYSGAGYIVNTFGASTSFISNVLSVILPIGLWVVANWCLTTLFDGEGSLKDIFIATSYSLLPMTLLGIPATLMTHMLAADEMQIITLISSISYVWVGLLIFIGMMVTHGYSMFKSISTCVFSIVGIVFIIFVAVLFSSLVAKLIMFIASIAQEIAFHA